MTQYGLMEMMPVEDHHDRLLREVQVDQEQNWRRLEQAVGGDVAHIVDVWTECDLNDQFG
jgi:hypothetical protein